MKEVGGWPFTRQTGCYKGFFQYPPAHLQCKLNKAPVSDETKNLKALKAQINSHELHFLRMSFKVIMKLKIH